MTLPAEEEKFCLRSDRLAVLDGIDVVVCLFGLFQILRKPKVSIELTRVFKVLPGKEGTTATDELIDEFIDELIDELIIVGFVFVGWYDVPMFIPAIVPYFSKLWYRTANFPALILSFSNISCVVRKLDFSCSNCF